MNRNHSVNKGSAITIAFWVIALTVGQGENVLALGCNTQQRISGEIGGCNSISTQDWGEISREKYSACIEQQLEVALADYKQDRWDYYTTWQWQEEQTEESRTAQPIPIKLQVGWISACNKT